MSTEGNESRFFGRFQYKADSKGRVTCPLTASTKDKLTLYLLIVPATEISDRCLICMTEKQFADYYKRLSRIRSVDSGYRLAKIVLASVDEVTTDSAGKILINKYLRDYAGIVEKVTMIPTRNGLEIWSAERLEKEEDTVLSDKAMYQMFDTISNAERIDPEVKAMLADENAYLDLQVGILEARKKLRDGGSGGES